jgi:glycosyltransferase involved in cell wall biosynthesis
MCLARREDDMFNFLKRGFFDKALWRSRNYRVAPAVRRPDIQSEAEFYLTSATIVYNEGKYLREFLAFHRLVGIDHMLIYDDGSTDDTADILAPFIKDGFVTLIPWSRFVPKRNHQFLAYVHAVAQMRGRCRWLAMIDADEFLFSPSGQGLVDELRKREAFSALGIYSHTFGTSGVEELTPGDLVIDKLCNSAPGDYVKNRTQRTIVDPNDVISVRSANTCVLRGTSMLGWDENGKPIYQTGEQGHSRENLRINHYFTRATNDFKRKTERRYFGNTKWQAKAAQKLDEGQVLDQACQPDDAIRRWIAPLRQVV